jgi:tRNA nucleotidyltransferase (CCA-adding enzyme)
LRVLRFAARMGFKLEQRTQEWFDLAIERDLQHTITPEDAGAELRALAREENPAAILKSWEEHDLMETVHPVLAKKHPDYDSINRLSKVRDDLFMAGLRPRLATPMMLAILGRLKDREQGSLLNKLGFRSAEVESILEFEEETVAAAKELAGKKLATPIDAYRFLEKMPVDRLAHLLAFSSNSGAVSKIRAYLNKWRPLRQGIPAVANELTAIGMPAGPKFDAIVQQVFAMQLTGRGKTPEEREKILRKLSGIKEQPKPKETKGKEKKGAKVVSKAVAVATKLAAPAAKTATPVAAPAKGQKAAPTKKPEKKKKK